LNKIEEMSNRMQKKLEQINLLPNVSLPLIPDLPGITLDIVQSLDMFNLTSKSNFNATRNAPAKLHQDLANLFHLNMDIFNMSGKVLNEVESTKQILPNISSSSELNPLALNQQIFNSSQTKNHRKQLQNDPFRISKLNMTNFNIFNITKHVQQDFQTNMNWTNAILSNLDFLNVSNNLNVTNQHLQNITKMLLPNLTMPEVQEIFSALDLLNISRKIQSDLLPNMDSINPFSMTNLNATKFDIINITKHMQQDFESNMNWTQNFLTTLDFLNVSTNLNATNLHLQNVTKMLLPNLTLPEVQEVLSSLDFLKLNTTIDLQNVTLFMNFTLHNILNLTQHDLLLNVTRQKVAEIEDQITKSNPIIAQLKAISQEIDNSTTDEDIEEMLNMTSHENLTDATKFIIARIKDMQKLHPSMKAVVKNIVGPAAYLKNNPLKAQDLKLAMTVFPKILPYILEANTPKLETFLKVGTKFSLGELYQIHKSLVDLHRFAGKLRDGFDDDSSHTLAKLSEMVMEKNIHLMRTILVFMVRADKNDKNLFLEEEDIRELQKYLVSPSDLYSTILTPQ